MPRDFLALIPARGGSQGVPRKNLELVAGRSLLERAIESVNGVNKIGLCYVSSDDHQILELAHRHGAIAIRRKESAASNSARAHEVVGDFLEQLPEVNDETVIVYLQPTSPFRTARRVAEAVAAYETQQGESLVSVARSHQLPEKTLDISPSGLLELSPAAHDPGMNRQDFPTRVYPNGAIYIFSVSTFRRVGDIPIVGAIPFMMNKVESLDIDDVEDLILARGVASYAGI